MMVVIIAVAVVSLIASALAAMLVISEKLIANYGSCEIDINNGEKKINIDGGSDLLSALTEQKIFIPSACGGKGTCGYCKLKVLQGAREVGPTETPFLTPEEIKDNIRLSCQVKIRNDIKIEIPPQLLTIKEYLAKCVDITDLTYDIKQFRFELTEPAAIDYTPGQYIQLFTPRYKGSTGEVYRAYSVSSDPAQKNIIELVIKKVPKGICTTWCFEYLKTGDEVKFNGPYGQFCLSETNAPIIFIAGGSGMAPIKCMLHHMCNTNNTRKATYFFGANTTKDLCYIDQMKDFENKLENFEFVPVIANPEENSNWQGQTGLVTQAVQQNVKNASDAEAYLCGSPGMIDASIKVLSDLGVTEDRIFYDKFA